MIAPALLMSAGLLANQITISEVSAERDGGRIAIMVKGDAMIDPEAASATLGEGRLYLFVRDARVREANRAWDNDVAEGAEEIRAHRHRQRVELAIPLGDGACQGPVEFEKAPGGLRALVECGGGPRPIVARLKASSVKPAPRADAAVKVPGPAALSTSDIAALKAKLALDPAPIHDAEDDVPVPAKAAAAKAAPLVAAAPAAKAPAIAIAPSTAPAVPAKPAPRSGVGTGVADHPAKPFGPSPLPGSLAPAPASTPAATRPLPGMPAASPELAPASNAAVASSAGGGSVVLAGFAFLAVAGAAFFYSRRRRTSARHIEILETASLGPKRALVVARVGGARMILGSSEAGITLLQALPEAGEQKVESLAAQIIESMPTAEDAAWDAMVTATLTPATGVPAVPASPPAPAVVPAPAPPVVTIAAPSLVVVPPPARLPGTPAAPMGFEPTMKIEVEEAPNPVSSISLDSGEPRPVGQAGLLARLFRKGTPANDGLVPRFEDILEDSFEDQELRRKLALGLPGRVR